MSYGNVIEVVGAIIKDGDKYLIGQRSAHKSQGGLWEFMGGKIVPGETPEEALKRECLEELALEIENERIIDSVVHEYPEKTIRLTLIECNPKKWVCAASIGTSGDSLGNDRSNERYRFLSSGQGVCQETFWRINV